MAEEAGVTFAVLLGDEDDANGLAGLLDDLQRRDRVTPTGFVVPPVRGPEFFVSRSGRLSSWRAEHIPAGSSPVYLIYHQPGLARLISETAGVFYVGVRDSSEHPEYDDSARVFPAESVLSFAAAIMHDFSRPDSPCGDVFDDADALRMAAQAFHFRLPEDPPHTLPGENEQVPPVVEAVMVAEKAFYGRGEEQRQFRELLNDLIATRPEKTNQPSHAHIFLVHGIGGIGKTELTKRLQDIALKEDQFRRRVRALRLNWEDLKLSSTLDNARYGYNLETILGYLAAAFDSRSDRRYLGSFHKVTNQIRRAEDHAAEQLRREGDEFAGITKLGISGVKLLLATVSPPGLAGVLDLGADQIPVVVKQAKGWLDRRVRAEDRRLLLGSDQLLCNAFAAGIRAASRDLPLVVILDTYELVSWADVPWLQSVYRQAGPRTAWVLAGRSTKSQLRDYATEWPPPLLGKFELGKLNRDEIAAYMIDQVPDRQMSDAALLELVAVTHGIPLAVYIAANLWRRGASLELITGSGGAGTGGEVIEEQVVESLFKRFLKYAQQDLDRPADYDRLRALALLPDLKEKTSPQDADLLAALWGVDKIEVILRELEWRYEFVLPGKMRLHDEVSRALRGRLMSPAARRDIRAMNHRAIDYLAGKLAELQDDLPTLEARCRDDQWRETVLALAWHRFWDGNEAGWATTLATFPAAIAFNAELSGLLLEQASGFAKEGTQAEQRRLATLQEDRYAMSLSQAAIADFKRIRRKSLVQPDDGCADERAAILEWQDGRNQLYRNNDSASALESFRQAALLMPDDSEELRALIVRDLVQMSYRSTWHHSPETAVPSELALNAAVAATALSPRDESCWLACARVLWLLQRDEEAVTAYNRAIEINPDSAPALSERGNALLALERYKAAVADYDGAIERDPYSVAAHSGRGYALVELMRYEEALTAFDVATALDRNDTGSLMMRGDVLFLLNRHEEALAVYEGAIKSKPGDAAMRTRRGIALLLLDRCDEALADLDLAIEIDPSNAHAYRNRSSVYVRLGRENEALKDARLVLELDSGDARSHELFGRLLLEQGEFDSAESSFLETTRIAPRQRPAGWVFAGAIAWHYGRIEIARERCAAGLECHHPYFTAFTWGELQALALSCLGHGDDAVEILVEASRYRLPGEWNNRALYEMLSRSPMLPDRFDEIRAIAAGP